jgi:hypothetical protein
VLVKTGGRDHSRITYGSSLHALAFSSVSISMILGFCGDGSKLPIMFIFKGEPPRPGKSSRILKPLYEAFGQRAIFAVSKKAFSSKHLTKQYLSDVVFMNKKPGMALVICDRFSRNLPPIVSFSTRPS